MKRHVFIFLGTFTAGAVIAFGARAALHDPHAGHAPAGSATMAATASPDAAGHGDSHGSSHGTHGTPPPAPAAQNAPAADAPVNTVCAICGMKVNPKIAPETYKGKKVGFGCAACPPVFRENPDKYGPAALRNEVVED